MTILYFIRHGEYENPQNILPVRMSGFPLSDKGKQTIKRVCQYFVTNNLLISKIYTSPILRCKESAEIISSIMKIPFTVDTNLLEVRSPFEGWDKEKATNEIVSFGDTFTHPYHIQGKGETTNELYTRMNRFVMSNINTSINQSIIAVSHGDPIMVYTTKAEGNILDNNHTILSYGPYIPYGGIVQCTYISNRISNVIRYYE